MLFVEPTFATCRTAPYNFLLGRALPPWLPSDFNCALAQAWDCLLLSLLSLLLLLWALQLANVGSTNSTALKIYITITM